jgi:hypothetical protein
MTWFLKQRVVGIFARFLVFYKKRQKLIFSSVMDK